jgi:hypothetical protein
VLAIITAASYVWTWPTDILQKYGFLIFFVIFCLYMGVYIYIRDKRIRELGSEKPCIIVDPLPYLDSEYACLKVTNNGEKGEFWVQTSLLSEFRGGKWVPTGTYAPMYDGVWQSNNTNKVEIPNGQSDYIKISHVTLDKGQTLELLRYDTSNKSVSRRYWQNWDWTVSPTQYVPKPEYDIQVNITSAPSLKEGAFIKDYRVTLDNIEALKTKSKVIPFKSD